MTKQFIPEHLNATPADLAGNHGIGRYIFLPGSDHRAKQIAERFDNTVVKQHERGHNLYLGTISLDNQSIDVASVASGMGCPSAEIIVHELFHLGAKRFLRVGTAGSLQPDVVKVGDIVNAQASVRDENTTTHYAPPEFPALASLEFTSSIMLAAERIGLADHLHTGMAHCKSAFYASEFGAGPRATDNKAYLLLLAEYGVLASEMETATIFVQSQIYNHVLGLKGTSPDHRVLAGAILSIISSSENFDRSEKAATVIQNAISLAIESVKILASQECLQ